MANPNNQTIPTANLQDLYDEMSFTVNLICMNKSTNQDNASQHPID